MIKNRVLLISVLALIINFSFFLSFVLAEDKPPELQNGSASQIFPKLPTTPNDPHLKEAKVYPMWGPVCQRYTYSVVYQDEKNRPPKYVRMYFNGSWLDLEKENEKDTDYQKGVRYIYKFVPTKLGSNFYFFEASNGLGKARDGIIDSPDNGPVLFDTDFSKNEIALINPESGEKVWSFNTGKQWVGGLSISRDGLYLAAKTTSQILLFNTSTKKAEPKWRYSPKMDISGGDGDVKGGVAISADGSKIFALLGNRAILFNQKSNQPIWQSEINISGYNVAISADGNYAAAATVQSDNAANSNSLIVWDTKSKSPIWKYQASGNFHDISFSEDGKYIAASTGCPDRRAYFFSIDSNQPITKSETLTRDSPVHRARISADGSVAAFGAESGDGAVHLFAKNSKDAQWKFSTPTKSSVRALGITPDGRFIGAATFSGHAYIFAKESSNPIATWQIQNARLGAVDIADDGRFLVVGGTDKKVSIFQKDSSGPKAEIEMNEYIGEIDISGNGQYVAAGTSGSVYFFESFTNESKVFDCSKVIEPETEQYANMVANKDIPKNNSQSTEINNLKRFQITSIIIAVLSFLLLTGFFILIKLRKIKLNKIILTVLLLISVFSLGTAAYFYGQQKSVSDQKNIDNQSFQTDTDSQIKKSSKSEGKNKAEIDSSDSSATAECGNTICEPNLGESKQNCPKDCSGSN